MDRHPKTPLGLLEDAGYRVEVAEAFDPSRQEKQFHALAIDGDGEYRLVSAASQAEAIAELARQLGLEDNGQRDG